MRDYELMVILDPNLDEAGVEAESERVRSLVTARGGEVVSFEPWGRRRLAYPIKRFRDGYYAVVRFKMTPEESDALERALKLAESVIRHLIVRPEAA
jgi:small subunit ribosomal protein S6